MRFVLVFLICALWTHGYSQSIIPQSDRPKIVVGIVVDQMRQEYLYRYAPKFGKDGFMRLIGQGFMLSNGHYNYMPTYTGPGHASVYTGTTPTNHGIIGNDWFDKINSVMVNCVGDGRYKPVGSATGNGDVSPWRLISSTVTDELELATQRRSKVIGISLKDRGAVLPAGHMADGAYWYDATTGNFISSDYYKPELPVWLDRFNALKLADKYLNDQWNTLIPKDQYKESGPDDSPYEALLEGKEKPTFPYDLKTLRKVNGNFELLDSTPYGNEILTQLAFAAMDGEDMGNDEWTDFLAISYSATDAIGHSYGPRSIEVEDTYIRLDRNIADLLNKLDKDVGVGQYLIFLTSDHGVAEVPEYLMDTRVLNKEKTPPKTYVTELLDYLGTYYPGKNFIKKISNNQVFFDHAMFGTEPKSSSVEYLVVSELTRNFLMTLPGIADVYTKQALTNADYNDGGIRGQVRRGYHSSRSGDLAIVWEPGWLQGSGSVGTTHGSPFNYDTHVPMIFYGTGVKNGTTAKYYTIMDIAPTISILLQISFPSARTGQPIVELLK